MKAVDRPFYRAVYEATWDSAAVPDGLVDIKVKNPGDGEVRSQILVAVNGKPAIEVAADATLTFMVGRVIGASKAPKSPVDVLMNGESVGTIAPGRKKEYAFTVPAQLLRKVNTLAFRFAVAGDSMTVTYPFLKLSGQAIEDPFSKASRDIRLGHWPENIVDRAGFNVGDGLHEGGFNLNRSVFYFVVEEKSAAEPPPKLADGAIVIWKELEDLLPASDWSANGYRPVSMTRRTSGPARALSAPAAPPTGRWSGGSI